MVFQSIEKNRIKRKVLPGEVIINKNGLSLAREDCPSRFVEVFVDRDTNSIGFLFHRQETPRTFKLRDHSKSSFYLVLPAALKPKIKPGVYFTSPEGDLLVIPNCLKGGEY